jgi:hypothetical protein
MQPTACSITKLWSIIQTNSSGIQAVAAVGALIAALAGFVVLCIYAADTKKIARATLQQSQAVLLPFLGLTVENKDDHIRAEWHIKNYGSGPAVNIRYTPIDPIELVGQKAPILPGETRKLCSANGEDRKRLGEALRASSGFEIRYNSVAGEHLLSRIKQQFDGRIDTIFERGLI